MSDSMLINVCLIVTILCALLLGILLYRNRSRMINGFLFNVLIIMLSLDIALIGVTTQNLLFVIPTLLLGLIFILIMIFGVFVLVVALLKNSKTLMQKEGKRLANALTLFAALGLIAITLIFPWITHRIPDSQFFLKWILFCVSFAGFYFMFIFVNFMTSVFLYGFIKPRKNKDFIIVLGSGLREGREVPPLLASRIQAALDFYQLQKASGKDARIIFSGGQGSDELIPEGQAMLDYALDHGLNPNDGIAETRSTTTLENMKFSKYIMDEMMGDQPYHVAFSTNNFHVFRAAQYAQQVGLNAHGIGSRTAHYFLPNAIIREFIALIVMHPRFHIFVLCTANVIALILHFVSRYAV